MALTTFKEKLISLKKRKFASPTLVEDGKPYAPKKIPNKKLTKQFIKK